jgi:hypothetical protein
MRTSVASKLVLVGLIAGVASAYGCSTTDDSGANPFTMTTAGSGNAAAGAGNATAGSGNAAAGAGPGSAGSASTGGGTGMAGAGTGGTPATAGAGGQSPTAGAAGTGTGGAAPGGDITKVWKSDGYGKAAGAIATMTSLATMGVKDADCAAKLSNDTHVCGAWMVNRIFKVQLPQPYDPMKSYPLLFEGPGCMATANDLYQFPASFLNTVIRVGLQPSGIEAHGSNPGEKCFDDKEGDDSMDWVFYELLYDKLNEQLSFDRNRVFSAGNSSGSWFSNELGCKYAGDAKRPVRGVLPNTGGLPTDPAYVPTCTQAGMAGMWVHDLEDGTNPFAGNIVAIDRAMKVDKCAKQNYASAQADDFEDFPIGGGQAANVCKRIKNCDPLYPLVVCALPGKTHSSHPEIVVPGYPKFIGLFSAPPLAPQ